MAYPTGMTTCVATAGVPIDFAGEDCDIELVLTPYLGGNARAITWQATGQPVVSADLSNTGTGGQPAQVTVPHVDQPGVINGAGDAFTMWSYTAKRTVIRKVNGRTVERIPLTPKKFQPVQGQTSVDIDLIPDGSITSPTSAPIPAVTSVNGQTGAVTVEAATDASVAAAVTEPLTQAALAAQVGDAGTQVGAALAGASLKAFTTTREPVQAQATSSRGYLARIFTLVCGSDDETPQAAGGPTITVDTTNYRINGRGWKVTSAAAGGPGVYFSPVSPALAGQPRSAPPAQAVVVEFYVEEATKVTDAGVYIYNDPGLTTANRWSWFLQTNSPKQTIVTGWNTLRVPFNGSPARIKDIYRVMFAFNCNAATSVTLGHIYLECPDKARILLVNDGAYRSFDVNAYPRLKALGVPVTYAPAVSMLGPNSNVGGWDEKITVDELLARGQENGNSVSFHSWASEVTGSMTAAQLRAETAKALKTCQEWGARGRMWRAAWTQDSAPQYEAVRSMLVAAVSGMNSASPNMWPPKDLMNIYRVSIDNTQVAPIGTARVDNMMADLQRSNCLYVPFIHGVGVFNGSAGNQYNTDQALFDYLADQIEAGMGGGWLECVTFEDLFYGSGGSFTNLPGGAIAQIPNADGTVTAKRVL